jgi:hypothetical protein
MTIKLQGPHIDLTEINHMIKSSIAASPTPLVVLQFSESASVSGTYSLQNLSGRTLRVVGVSASLVTNAGGPDYPTLDVLVDDVSILTTAMTLTTAGEYYSGSVVANASIPADAVIQADYSVESATATYLSVAIWCEVQS